MLDESIFHGVKLIVVGNINRGIKSSPISPGDYLFRDGETPLAGVYETIGGGGANSAAVAARLGADVSFVGQVGDGALGRQLEQAMTRHGICCHLRKAPELATGSTLNLVFDTGQRHFLSCHPNNAALTFESLDLWALENAQHLHRADIWFSEEMLFGGNEKLFRVARAADVATSIDLNWAPMWSQASRARRAAAGGPGVWERARVVRVRRHPGIAGRIGATRRLVCFQFPGILFALIRAIRGLLRYLDSVRRVGRAGAYGSS